jgi:hypothetical protein
MRISAEYVYDASGAFQRLTRHGAAIPVDFGFVCLWTVFGLAMTALAFAFGFSVDVGQALALAG